MSSHRIVGSTKEELVIHSSLSGISGSNLKESFDSTYNDVKFNIEALLIL